MKLRALKAPAFFLVFAAIGAGIWYGGYKERQAKCAELEAIVTTYSTLGTWDEQETWDAFFYASQYRRLCADEFDVGLDNHLTP